MNTQNQKIRLSRALKFRIHNDGQVYGRLSNSDHEFYFAPEIIAILSYFAQQKDKSSDESKISLKKISEYLHSYFKDALNKLPTEKECKAIVDDLIAAGVLLTENFNENANNVSEGFADPWIQWAMLADSKRSLNYEHAIAEKVSKSSVVLDVGSGTGFLAGCALHHGAKKVYAIEASSIGDHIQNCLQSMKLITNKSLDPTVKPRNDNFELYRQNSFDVDLTSDINLIVSELFGNDPFQEGLYPTLQNIAKRITNKKVEYIPHKLIVYGELIDLKNHYAKERIHQYQTKPNDSFYSKWLSTVKSTLPFDSVSFPLNLTNKDFERISTSVSLGESRLDPPPLIDHKFSAQFSDETKLSIDANKIDTPVFIVWFRVFLTQDISLSSNPKESDHAAHWSPIAIALNQKIDAKSHIRVKYHLSDDNSLFECQVFDRDRLIGSRRFL